MIAALMMVTSFLFGKSAGIATAASFTGVVAALWYGIAGWTKLEEIRRARRAR
jgi:VIT1/CCC1 family predicted Fe2+/Mn2+ transporter